jgi:hypothetical protein
VKSSAEKTSCSNGLLPAWHPRCGRRKSAVLTSTAAALLQDRLGLSDEELLVVLDADPLTLLSGELEHRPQLSILLALTEEAAGVTSAAVLRRWLRTTGPRGRPADLLLARDFPAFEDALDDLRSRGFVIGG